MTAGTKTQCIGYRAVISVPNRPWGPGATSSSSLGIPAEAQCASSVAGYRPQCCGRSWYVRMHACAAGVTSTQAPRQRLDNCRCGLWKRLHEQQLHHQQQLEASDVATHHLSYLLQTGSGLLHAVYMSCRHTAAVLLFGQQIGQRSLPGAHWPGTSHADGHRCGVGAASTTLQQSTRQPAQTH